MTLIHAMLLQAGTQAGAAAPTFLQKYLFPIELALIMGIFYFLMIRPQQKQRKQHEAALRDIKKGDEVVTAGGLVGKVIHVRETVGDDGAKRTMEDRVTIETGESRVVVERGRIAKIGGVSVTPAKGQARANPSAG